MSNEDAVWAETTDGGLLKQLFGYYPTMHDAQLREIKIDPASDSIELTLDYNDMIGDDHTQHLSVRIRLEWHGIESFDFPIGCEDFMGVAFGRKGDKILTSIEMIGAYGSIVSESVEAILVRMDPSLSNESPRIRYK